MSEDVQADSQPEVTETPDYAAIDAAFERAYGSDHDPSAEEILGDPAETVADDTIASQEETPAVESETATQSETPAETTQSEEGPQIDQSLLALAVQEGANQADLDELVKSDPERANVLLTELQNEVNKETLRALQGQPSSTEQVGQSQQSATSEEAKVSALEELLTSEDALAAAKEEHGETYVEKYLLPLAEQAKAYRSDREFIAQARQEMEVQKQQALVQQLNSTFTSFGKGYEDFYGGDVAKANDEQIANRESVTKIADQLRVSDLMLNRPEQPIQNYLTKAHAVVSADQVRAAARKEIISQIKTRSNSTTAKPNRSRSSAVSSPDEAAMTAFDRKANELGLSDYFRD
jgi:hypothetical protein